MDEFTEKGAWLLYELILVAEQSAWCDVPNSFFKVLWIIDVLEHLEYAELVSILCGPMKSMLLPVAGFLRMCDFHVSFSGCV